MLLRQYKRVRAIKNEKFSYKDMQPVYTIVFMEKSPEIFHEFQSYYVHKFWNKSDTGLELKLLQNYIFIPVDIFLSKLHNNGINSELDAWLTFLGSDDVNDIDMLITEYPKFKPIYKQLYDLCCNVEGVMQMFSKELEIMDHNTVRLMIDEYQERVEELKKSSEELSEKIHNQSEKIQSQSKTIQNQNEKIQIQTETIQNQSAEIENQKQRIAGLKQHWLENSVR